MQEIIRYFASPLGLIRISGTHSGISSLDFTEAREDTETEGDLPLPGDPQAWLAAYFAGENPDPAAIPLAPGGTHFCRAVWGIITTIPYGRSLTYGEIAKKLGSAPRAVGQATGRNPIALLIPCHRVIGSGGKLTGYGPGLWRKRLLLEHEQAGTDWQSHH